MNSSEQIDQLATALSSAQSEFKGAKKDHQNPFFKSHYADLESVWDAVRDVLFRNGLSVAQYGGVSASTCTAVLFTKLMHKSGQWIEGMMPLEPVKKDPQGLGSAITYMRRYGLASMLGIVQVDDDGNEASRASHPKKANPISEGPAANVSQQAKNTQPLASLLPAAKLIAGNLAPEDWGQYKIPKGKFKDCMIKDIPENILRDWLTTDVLPVTKTDPVAERIYNVGMAYLVFKETK